MYNDSNVAIVPHFSESVEMTLQHERQSRQYAPVRAMPLKEILDPCKKIHGAACPELNQANSVRHSHAGQQIAQVA